MSNNLTHCLFAARLSRFIYLIISNKTANGFSSTIDNPAAGALRIGQLTTGNSVYDFYKEQLWNKPSIEGTRNYTRYWSVRRNKRVGGTIIIQDHFDAWQSKGLILGSHEWQVLHVMGYYSSGKANFTLST
jgi:endo-1,4-beta-xylanase